MQSIEILIERAQVVEHLPSKCKALNSNPSTTKKKRKRKYLGECGVRNSMGDPPLKTWVFTLKHPFEASL
jgi:hypothetical protein